jgi:lipopolysaccharide export LptBFGC system permease protein LptF
VRPWRRIAWAVFLWADFGAALVLAYVNARSSNTAMTLFWLAIALLSWRTAEDLNKMRP